MTSKRSRVRTRAGGIAFVPLERRGLLSGRGARVAGRQEKDVRVQIRAVGPNDRTRLAVHRDLGEEIGVLECSEDTLTPADPRGQIHGAAGAIREG